MGSYYLPNDTYGQSLSIVELLTGSKSVSIPDTMTNTALVNASIPKVRTVDFHILRHNGYNINCIQYGTVLQLAGSTEAKQENHQLLGFDETPKYLTFKIER